MNLETFDARVEVRELLGEGGMGEVHAAWDRALARAVAVKFIRGSDPRDAERLLLEARLQARVEHPNVVRVFEVGSLGGRPCILFQLVRGRTLAELASTLPVPDRVELVRQAATGLHAAHLEGLVHRDVKPGNILVEEAEGGGRTALVTDFGLAHAEEGGLTRSGLLPGTLDFMAPEQLSGEGPVDFRGDVYALGATLYAVLAGRPPFRVPPAGGEAGADEQVKLLRRILDEEAPPLRAVAPAIPAELSLVAAKAMEKEPAGRYASAEVFAEDLARFQRGEPVRVRRASPSERLLKWTRRNRAAARAVAAALVTLAAAAALALWQSHRAGVEALEAARLGSVASSLESRMRMEYLAPAHDLRPALAAVRAEVEALRPAAAGRGGGPASFALGKGLEILGDLDGARAAYERAWSLGFRTPQVAEGLGEFLGQVYQRESKRVLESAAPAEASERLEQLRIELRVPARRYLERGGSAGWHGPFLKARIAFLEGDFEAARARAAEALAADPGAYEARTLAGHAWLREATALRLAGKYREARAALDRAIPALEEALVWGRSDPEPHTHLAVARSHRAALLQRIGEDPSAELDATLAAADRVSVLNPDIPMVLSIRAVTLDTKARFLVMAGDARADAMVELENSLWRRVVKAQPGDARTLANFSMGLFSEIYIHRELLQKPTDDLLAEALASSAEAVRLAPRDAFVAHTRGLVLTHQVGAMLRAGQDASQVLDDLDRLCVAASRLDPRFEQLLGETALLGQEARARNEWRWGRDPRPAYDKAVTAAEALARASPDNVAVRGILLGLLTGRTALLVDMGLGAEARPGMERALMLGAGEAASVARGRVDRFQAAQVLTTEASRRVSLDQDPTGLISRARALVTEATRLKLETGDLAGALASLSLLEARWLAARGRDPGPATRRARGELAPNASQTGKMAENWKTLAACSLEEARWRARLGEPSRTAAIRGLAEVSSALGEDPRDPRLWILKAGLQRLAGDGAAARATLDAAYAIQPLVKRGREASAAEVLLGSR